MPFKQDGAKHGGAYRGAQNRNTEMRYRIGVLGEIPRKHIAQSTVLRGGIVALRMGGGQLKNTVFGKREIICFRTHSRDLGAIPPGK